MAINLEAVLIKDHDGEYKQYNASFDYLGVNVGLTVNIDDSGEFGVYIDFNNDNLLNLMNYREQGYIENIFRDHTFQSELIKMMFCIVPKYPEFCGDQSKVILSEEVVIDCSFGLLSALEQYHFIDSDYTDWSEEFMTERVE